MSEKLPGARAAVPDAATEREIAVIEEHREKWMARAFRAEAERDAALAAIERVRAIHYLFTPQLCYMNAQGGQSPMTSVHCHHCKPEGSKRVGDPDTWPCLTIQALDGAPEPDKGCGTCFTCIDRVVSAKPFPHNLEYPFIVCAECGNKRCPKAENHVNACTGSNEPGQSGALRYGGLPVEGGSKS